MGTTKIATWNVNSIRRRLGLLCDWLKEFAPDIVMLQELKTLADDFPRFELEALGYHLAVVGQKALNGVALLSKRPLEDVVEALPGDPADGEARYVEAGVGELIVASIYLPNGNPVDSARFPYKLAWMDRLGDRARELLASERPFVLAGDYNVCPSDDDVYDPQAFADDAVCRPESRNRFRRILNLGLTDAVQALHPGPHQYSYWDYKARRFHGDQGLRIDHLLLSPQAADRLIDAGIDRTPRARKEPSDHTPVWCTLED
ncbi:MAG: exodeoxyribonuclease III [Kiloniellales bacterium]